MGYHQAGFDVVGVDIGEQPHYPFEFIRSDVFDLTDEFLSSFDAIHASPPCQAYSNAQRLRKRRHPSLVADVREWLKWIGNRYVIENVPGAPLIEPVTLCGAMFGLKTYRHRWFEADFEIAVPDHPAHDHPQAKMGRPVKAGEFIQVVGNFSGVEYARMAMGIDWMTRDELREAIPPAFTRWIGMQLIEHLQSESIAA